MTIHDAERVASAVRAAFWPDGYGPALAMCESLNVEFPEFEFFTMAAEDHGDYGLVGVRTRSTGEVEKKRPEKPTGSK